MQDKPFAAAGVAIVLTDASGEDRIAYSWRRQEADDWLASSEVCLHAMRGSNWHEPAPAVHDVSRVLAS